MVACYGLIVTFMCGVCTLIQIRNDSKWVGMGIGLTYFSSIMTIICLCLGK